MEASKFSGAREVLRVFRRVCRLLDGVWQTFLGRWRKKAVARSVLPQRGRALGRRVIVINEAKIERASRNGFARRAPSENSYLPVSELRHPQ